MGSHLGCTSKLVKKRGKRVSDVSKCKSLALRVDVNCAQHDILAKIYKLGSHGSMIVATGKRKYACFASICNRLHQYLVENWEHCHAQSVAATYRVTSIWLVDNLRSCVWCLVLNKLEVPAFVCAQSTCPRIKKKKRLGLSYQ